MESLAVFQAKSQAKIFLLNWAPALGATHAVAGGQVRQERRLHQTHLGTRAAQDPSGPHAAARNTIRNGIHNVLAPLNLSSVRL